MSVMDLDGFEQRFRLAQDRLAEIRHHSESTLLVSAADELDPIAELNITLEELQVSIDELHQQTEELSRKNEELLITRQQVEWERQRYQDLFEFAPHGYVITDQRGVIRELNCAALTLFNVPAQNYLVGKPLDLLIAERDRLTFRSYWAKLETCMAQLNSRGFRVKQYQICSLAGLPTEWELFLQPRQTDQPVPASILVAATCDQHEHSIRLCWLLQDLSDRKRAEEEKRQLEAQFLRSQRLECIGTLTGGIAHDLNNVLQPILATAQVLQRRFPHLDERNRQLLKILEDSAQRGGNLVKQVLSFSRGAGDKQALLQIEPQLKEIVRLLKGVFPKAIQVRAHLPAQALWLVKVNGTQLHQVLMNLCVNARDAMPTGGMLGLSAANTHLDEMSSHLHPDAIPGDYVVLTVADTGTGMSSEVLEQIFQPFFTTKDVEKGTGLGLSTVLGIVKDHAGFVQVESEVDKGTTFKVYLPAIITQTPYPTAIAEPPQGHGERILVVDDEVMIREATRALLELHGYEVCIASSGLEAIAVYQQHQHDFQVVLLDLMMPMMNGLQVIPALKALNPHVKIVAMSASGLNDSSNSLPEIGSQAFLVKPYTTDDLLNTLRDVLKA
jgi:signal transduction histidine kinase